MLKKKTFLVICFTLLLSLYIGKVFAQNVAINITGTAANTSAGLDVDFTDKGLLIPRVALTTSTSASPITSPTTSLLVYNTATAGDVTPGFYFWDGTTAAWIRLVSGAPVGSGVTSVTATVPVYSSGGSTPVISLQGTAGTVCYGTGGGSSFTAAGTAGQVLTSNGATAPTWASNQVSQFTNIGASFASLPPAAGVTMSAGGWGFLTYTPGTSLVSFQAQASLGLGAYYSRAAQTLKNVRVCGWFNNQTATGGIGNITIYLMKYSLGAGPLTLITTTAAGTTGTSLGNVITNLAVQTNSYPFDLNIGTVTLAAGDVIVPILVNSSGSTKSLYWGGKMSWTTDLGTITY